MDTIVNAIPSMLEGTSLKDPLCGLLNIYRRIDAAQQQWTAASPFRCPFACGECCRTFEPSILEIEALLLASYLVYSRTFLQPVFPAGKIGCVYHDPSGAYHCPVYSARPLICRLFAFSGSYGKDGLVRYKPCKHMEEVEHRTMEEPELRRQFGMLPPVMADLAREADCLLPGSAGITMPLREAVPPAVDKIRYLMALNGRTFSGFTESGDNPDDDAPTFPRAS